MVIGLIIAAGVVILAGAGAAYLLLAPEAEKQLAPGSGDLLVVINQPMNGGRVTVGQPVTISADAVSEQVVTSLVLSVNGIDLPRKIIDNQKYGNRYSSILSWTPTKEGRFTLLAYATSENGIVGLSNAVQVIAEVKQRHVNEELPGPIPAPVQTQMAAAPDQTLNSAGIEAALGGPVIDSNVIEFGEQPMAEAVPEDTSTEKSLPAKFILRLQEIPSKLSPMVLPAAPEVKISPGHCSAILRAADRSETEAGFFVYRLDPGKEFFSRVATLDGHTGMNGFTYIDRNLPSGNYNYYLASFNSAGESAGNTAFVTVASTDCPTPALASLDFSEFNINPVKPVEKMYCYMTTGGNKWIRVPAGRDTFVYPKNGKYNFGSLFRGTFPEIPTSAEIRIHADCWGWQGDNLQGLGQFTETLHNKDTGNPYDAWLADQINESIDFGDVYQIGPVKAPFNLHIGNPACTYYVGGKKETCKETTTETKKKSLFWEWTQYPDSCSFPYLGCPYKPADAYRVYSLCPNNTSPQLVAEIADPERKYLIGLETGIYDRPDCVQQSFFVRAYNKQSGESDNSNLVEWAKGGTVHILYPTRIEQSRTVYTYLFNGSDWDWPNAHDDEDFLKSNPLIGYTAYCDLDYSPFPCFQISEGANLRFSFPADTGVIKDASLYWTISDISATGAGIGKVNENCGVISYCWGPHFNYVCEVYGKTHITRINPGTINYFLGDAELLDYFDGKLSFGLGRNMDLYPPFHPSESCEFFLQDAYLEYTDIPK